MATRSLSIADLIQESVATTRWRSVSMNDHSSGRLVQQLGWHAAGSCNEPGVDRQADVDSIDGQVGGFAVDVGIDQLGAAHHEHRPIAVPPGRERLGSAELTRGPQAVGKVRH
jgi:hypothetical protein